jgi:hypothetical protein
MYMLGQLRSWAAIHDPGTSDDEAVHARDLRSAAAERDHAHGTVPDRPQTWRIAFDRTRRTALP